ncbi:unnamed protein product [Urochloa humidicola]
MLHPVFLECGVTVVAPPGTHSTVVVVVVVVVDILHGSVGWSTRRAKSKTCTTASPDGGNTLYPRLQGV